MNPITREESLLDGQDLTPITRKEKFIKRIYDKTQEVPTPVTREEWFLKKAGEGTSPVTIEQLNATENGTYSETGKAYSPVIVDVPAPTLITKTITENGTYNASSDNADGYSQVTVNVPYMEKKSASGDIASFSDGAGYPFLKVKANINPVQDLHGYDYPWVGGAGKNLANLDEQFPITRSGITITKNDDGSITVNGTATASVTIVLMAEKSVANGAWTISGVPVNSAGDYFGIWARNTLGGLEYNSTRNGVSGTVNISTGTIYIYCTVDTGVSVNNVTCYLQLEYGSTATSYSPYSNICPISGFTGVNAQRVGKNLLNPNDVGYGNYTISPNGSYVNENKRIATSYIPCSAGQTYSVSGQVKATYSNKIFAFIGVAYFDKDYNYITRTASNQVDELISTAPQGAKYLRMFEEITNYEEETAITPNVYNSVYKRQLELSATPTTYEPSEGITVSVSWQDEAGIVYGGYIDLVSGVLTATKAGIAEYNGETLPSAWISDRDRYVAGNTPTIGAQVVYDLATPQTYQLTPQQINTLIGQNNIWNNTNGQTEVEYFIPIE